MNDCVSLVIASRNRGAKIGPTLASVFAQTRVPDEVLVVNDGGFTETREFIAANFPSVRVVDAMAGSAGAARNHGVNIALHPLLMFLDDDDLLHPHAVETLLRTLRTFPEARAAFADHTFTDQTTGYHVPNHHRTLPSFQRLTWVKPVKASGDVRLFDRHLYRPMLRGNLLQQPWLIERDAFLQLGGYTSVPCNEDWEFYLRIVRTHIIALSDTVISDHILEAGRQHLSRSSRFDDTSVEIIRKNLRLCLQSSDMRSAAILLRRLALHHKAAGDQLFPVDRWAGWREYLRSFRTWPFDHVVAARTLVVWPLKMIVGRGPAPSEARS